MWLRFLPALLLPPAALFLGACGGAGDEQVRERDGGEVRAEGDPISASEDAGGARSSANPGPRARAAEPVPTVLFLGDSLTAGYGLAEEQAYPALVSEALAARGLDARVVNAGVSGDTSAGGLARLDWLLRQEPEVVVVALGANDGLRGLAVEQTEANLRRIVERSREAGARVLLAGMRLPPNYGSDYVRRFEALFPRLAEELDVPLVPFLLEGVAADPDLNLADGIHPNAEGQRFLAANVLPGVVELLDEAPGS